MADNEHTYRVFISAGEVSGDAHCARLIKSLKKSGKSIEFVGVGGDKMAAAGCELLENTTSRAAMAAEALMEVVFFFKLILRIKYYFSRKKIDLVIVCDSPAFNFHVAKAAKKADIQTLFYVAPQLWAWGQWRMEKLKKCCDRLACILSFEEEWFAKRGLEASFVGNPLLDEIDINAKKSKKKYKDFSRDEMEIVLVPGSRLGEIRSLWQPMQRIAIQLRRKHPQAVFTAVAVDEQTREILRSMYVLGFSCKYDIGSVTETARRADFCISSSGSATLEVAAGGCPMVIMYQSNRFLWHAIGRWLIKTKFLSLVNILAKKELVPEFMPYFTSTVPIGETVEEMLGDTDKLIEISRELVELAEPLGRGNASENTAEIVIDMLV